MRIEAIEKRMPPPPTPPATGWLTIKQAVEALHRSKPTLYAWARTKKINSVRHNGLIYVDPTSIK